MADLQINIPSPILDVGEKFKYRYKLLPSGGYTSYTDVFTNSFTITGLAAGSYQVEIIFITADGIDCNAFVRVFDVQPEYICTDFVAQMVEDPTGSGLFYIEINFAAHTPPPCGWIITTTQGNVTKTNRYPSLPASGTLRIASPNKNTTVTIAADLCNNRTKQCYTVSVSAVPVITPCVPIVILDTDLLYDELPNQYSIRILFQQSTPPTLGINIVWKQLGTPLVASQNLDSGSKIFPGWVYTAQGANFVEYLLVYPIAVIGQIRYEVKMIDQCGTAHIFTVVL